jgi:hypothetical protein
MITNELTGKTRYRVQKRFLKPPLIIVQVEIHKKGTTYLSSGYYGYSQEVNYFVWEDATLENLSMLKERKA